MVNIQQTLTKMVVRSCRVQEDLRLRGPPGRKSSQTTLSPISDHHTVHFMLSGLRKFGYFWKP